MGNRTTETETEGAEKKGVSASAILAEIKELRARIESLEAFRRGEKPRYAATVTAPDAE